MVIQYGYVTMFAASFPLAPLLAVLNNIVEIRTDALKILTSFSRPHYRGASNIGSWYDILELLGIAAVITNCLLIGFTLNSVADLYGVKNSLGHYEPIVAFRAFATIVVLEHILFMAKYFLSFAIPDMPGWIDKALGKQEWIKEQTLQKRATAGVELTVWKDTIKYSDDEKSDSEDEEKPEEEEKKKRKSKKEKKSKKAKAEVEDVDLVVN